MTKKFSLSLAGGLLAAALLVGTTAARADMYVIESTVAAVNVGSHLERAMTASPFRPIGQIRAVLPSGKTQTIRGPFNGKVSDLAKGTPNEGVWAWMTNMAKTGGSSEITTGATRSVAPAGKPRPFSWVEVPTGVNGSICVEKGAKVLLTRTATARLDRATLVDAASGERAEVKWEAGSQTAEWPSSLQLRADGAYQLFQQDRPKRDVTLRIVDKLPAEDDLLAELQKLGCQHQFNAWLRDKMAAGGKS